MKRQRLILLVAAAAAVLTPFKGWTITTEASTNASASPPPKVATDLTKQLSPPVQDVVKLIKAGVSADVVTAYVQSSSSTFNLAPQTIIQLQDMGIPGPVTTAMLSHDKELRDKGSMMARSTPPAQPPSNEEAQPETQAPPYTADQLYSNLAPYGSWGDMTGYGPYWQPYSWLGYNSYPWGWLGGGSWSFFPTQGWCWFPSSHFHNHNNFAHFNHFNNFNRFNNFNHFANANRFNNFNHFNNGFNSFNHFNNFN